MYGVPLHATCRVVSPAHSAELQAALGDCCIMGPPVDMAAPEVETSAFDNVAPADTSTGRCTPLSSWRLPLAAKTPDNCRLGSKNSGTVCVLWKPACFDIALRGGFGATATFASKGCEFVVTAGDGAQRGDELAVDAECLMRLARPTPRVDDDAHRGDEFAVEDKACTFAFV
mmetsp:Transcript_33899/g.56008  ORF Transcript_33899/g.56008 Transcript_33899/m.56008 type:complete len:172 (+) Transcript_33899:558-1073(+)